jgi:hypothetical protein
VLYGIFFLALAALCAYYGVLSGAPKWWLLWPGVTCLLLAEGYLGLGGKVLGKRSDGSIRWYMIPVAFPYFIYCWSKWLIMRLFTDEAAFDRILPYLYIGRFAFPRAIPANVRCIVDLAAEFPEPAKSRKERRYIGVPVLDGWIPTKKEFLSLLETLRTVEGPIYLHCAEGHGRSGTIAVGFLILIGEAVDTQEALDKLRGIRPRIRLESCQRQFLKQMLPEILSLRVCLSKFNSFCS